MIVAIIFSLMLFYIIGYILTRAFLFIMDIVENNHGTFNIIDEYMVFVLWWGFLVIIIFGVVIIVSEYINKRGGTNEE